MTFKGRGYLPSTVIRCTPTHTPGSTCGRSVHFYTLYHVHPIFLHLFLYCDWFALPALRVNLMWTFYKGDRWGRQKNGWNMCSVMCAMIDMLTLSFQAAASKPRLAALIGFSGVCCSIWQRYLRRSVVHSMLRNAQLSLETSAGYSEYCLSLLMLRWWLIMPCVSAGRAVLKTCRHPKKTSPKFNKKAAPMLYSLETLWLIC